jgi:hypothetical protein
MFVRDVIIKHVESVELNDTVVTTAQKMRDLDIDLVGEILGEVAEAV